MSPARGEATARSDDPGKRDAPGPAMAEPERRARPVAVPPRRRRASAARRRGSGTFLFLLGALLVAAIGVVVILVVFPIAHVSSRSTTLAATPATVYALISNVERYPEWRTGTDRVEILDDDGAGMRFREYRDSGAITYRVEVAEAPSQFRVRIDDPDVPFEGTWTFAVVDGPLGTELTILETGQPFTELYQLVAFAGLATPGTKEQLLADLREVIRGGRQEP